MRQCLCGISVFVVFLTFVTSPAFAEVKVEEQDVGPVGTLQDVNYVVSPRGGHLATVAHKGSKMAVILDGEAGPKFDEIITPSVGYIDPRPYQNVDINLSPRNLPVTFSRDGKRIAYVARQSQEWVVMADGKEMLRIPAGVTGQDIRLVFSGDDGKHLFFAIGTPPHPRFVSAVAVYSNELHAAGVIAQHAFEQLGGLRESLVVPDLNALIDVL